MAAESVVTCIFAALALGIGMTAGAAELLPRYRDEPFRTVARLPALIYLTVNGLVGLSAYALLRTYEQIVPLVEGDMLGTALVAGFGGMAVFRARLFTISTPDGPGIRVGPDAAVTALLNALDSAIDRHRAQRRLGVAVGEVAHLPIDLVEGNWEDAVSFIEASIGAFQHLDDLDKSDLRAAIEALSRKELGTRVSLIAMSWALLNAGGEGTYRATMKHLANHLRGSTPPSSME